MAVSALPFIRFGIHNMWHQESLKNPRTFTVNLKKIHSKFTVHSHGFKGKKFKPRGKITSQYFAGENEPEPEQFLT